MALFALDHNYPMPMMRRIVCSAIPVLIALAAALGAGSAARARAAAPRLYPLPDATHAEGIAVGGDGTVWLNLRYGTERRGPRSYVGRIEGDGVFSELSRRAARALGFPIPGENGAVWFVGNRPVGHNRTVGSLVRVAPGGGRRAYHVPPRFGLLSPAAAGRGFVWFGYEGVGRHARQRIGRISLPAPHGVETEYTLGPGCQAEGMAAAGRAVYFGEACERGSRSGEMAMRSRIVRIGPTGAVRRFPLPGKEGIGAIAVGPEGVAWFALPGYGYSLVGWIGRAGKVTEYRVHDAMTTSIAVGRHGRLWGVTSVGGGGAAHQIEGMHIENQPGAVGHLPL